MTYARLFPEEAPAVVLERRLANEERWLALRAEKLDEIKQIAGYRQELLRRVKAIDRLLGEEEIVQSQVGTTQHLREFLPGSTDWMTAAEISKATGLDYAATQGALANLRAQGEVDRRRRALSEGKFPPAIKRGRTAEWEFRASDMIRRPGLSKNHAARPAALERALTDERAKIIAEISELDAWEAKLAEHVKQLSAWLKQKAPLSQATRTRVHAAKEPSSRQQTKGRLREVAIELYPKWASTDELYPLVFGEEPPPKHVWVPRHGYKWGRNEGSWRKVGRSRKGDDLVHAVTSMLTSGELEEEIDEWEARRRQRGWGTIRGKVRATDATRFPGPKKPTQNRRRTSRRRTSRR